MPLQSRRRNLILLALVAALVVIVAVSYRSTIANAPPEKPLSDLLTALDNRQVAGGTFTSNGDRLNWTDVDGHQFRTFLTGSYADILVDRFHQQRLAIRATPNGSDNLLLSVILPNLILFLLIGGFMWYMLRQTSRWQRPRSSA